MNRLVLASALISIGLVSAHAADQSIPDPSVSPALVGDWIGFYAGLNAGYSRAETSTHYEQQYTSSFVPSSQSGPFVGGQAGYNWQSGTTVIGVETDIQYRHTSKASQFRFPSDLGEFAQPFGSTVDDTAIFNSQQNWLGTLRGRVGLTNGPTLYYATGGVAYGEVKHFYGEAVYPADTINRSISDNQIKVGWTVGAGRKSNLQAIGLPVWSIFMLISAVQN